MASVKNPTPMAIKVTQAQKNMSFFSNKDRRPENSRTGIRANEVKSEIFPRKNSFLLIPIHPTVSTFFCFCMILGSIAAIKKKVNRATTTISFSMSMPPYLPIAFAERVS